MNIVMHNKAMQRKLDAHEAIDVSKFPRTPEGDYILRPRGQTRAGRILTREEVENMDLCDAQTEAWIWSVGVENGTGRILASVESKFYQHPDFECIWLR